jgi:hypothetical protein
MNCFKRIYGIITELGLKWKRFGKKNDSENKRCISCRVFEETTVILEKYLDSPPESLLDGIDGAIKTILTACDYTWSIRLHTDGKSDSPPRARKKVSNNLMNSLS